MATLKEKEAMRKKAKTPTEDVVMQLTGRNISNETHKVGRPVGNKEVKIRKTFALTPSVMEDFQKIAYLQRKSMSEILEELIIKYNSDNAVVLEMYSKLNDVK